MKIVGHINKIKKRTFLGSHFLGWLLYNPHDLVHSLDIFFSTSFPTIYNFHFTSKTSGDTLVAQHGHSSYAEDNELLWEGEGARGLHLKG